MRLSRAWTVATNDFKIFKKKKSILYSLIGFEIFVSIGLPLLILFIARKPAGLAVLPYLINSFSFWFIISCHSANGNFFLIAWLADPKNLEPAIAPTTDEILAGKQLQRLSCDRFPHRCSHLYVLVDELLPIR
jgi:hypothetical protein